MATSDFKPEVEIWPFCACAMKYMHYYPYFWTKSQKLSRLTGIGVRKVDCRPEVEIWPFSAREMKSMYYNPDYMNSSVIVDSAMGQVPCSTERNSVTSYF